MKKKHVGILFFVVLMFCFCITKEIFSYTKTKKIHLLLEDKTYRSRAKDTDVACYLKELDIPIYISPNRYFGEDLSKKNKPTLGKSAQCPMCLDKETANIVKLTKKFRITPNKYPYFKKHFIVLSNEHIKQDDFMNTSILEEALKIHKDFSNFSMYFNQYAGNTIEHLHFHLIDEKLPIENKVLNITGLAVEQTWQPYRHMPNALLYYGKDPKTLAKRISSRLYQITKQNLAYNLQCFHHNGHQAIVVWIRRSEPEFIRILPDNWLLTLSAFDLSGAFVIKNTSIYNAQNNTMTVSAWDTVVIHTDILEKHLKYAYQNSIIYASDVFSDVPNFINLSCLY